jgi:hypothetical protein
VHAPRGSGFATYLKYLRVQVRLFHRAVVVANNQSGSMRGIVLQLGIDQFENEGRRVAAGAGAPVATTPQKFSVQDPTARGSLFNMGAQELSIHRRVIQELLRPHDWVPPDDRSQFFLHGKELNELCGMVESVLQARPRTWLIEQSCARKH